jgi:hypothetical protein
MKMVVEAVERLLDSTAFTTAYWSCAIMQDSDVETQVSGPEALIETGAPFAELRKCFPTRLDALRYYARAQAARHQAPGSDKRCDLCGHPEDAVGTCDRVIFKWKAPLKSFKVGWTDLLLHCVGLVRVTLKEPGIEFSTAHALCAGCWRQNRSKRAFAALLNVCGLFSVFFGAGLGACALGLYLKAPTFQTADRQMYGGAAIAGGIGVLAGTLALWLRHHLQNPAQLRSIGRKPFSCIGCSKRV